MPFLFFSILIKCKSNTTNYAQTLYYKIIIYHLMLLRIFKDLLKILAGSRLMYFLCGKYFSLLMLRETSLKTFLLSKKQMVCNALI